MAGSGLPMPSSKKCSCVLLSLDFCAFPKGTIASKMSLNFVRGPYDENIIENVPCTYLVWISIDIDNGTNIFRK
jgi:hypothetical protein